MSGVGLVASGVTVDAATGATFDAATMRLVETLIALRAAEGRPTYGMRTSLDLDRVAAEAEAHRSPLVQLLAVPALRGWLGARRGEERERAADRWAGSAEREADELGVAWTRRLDALLVHWSEGVDAALAPSYRQPPVRLARTAERLERLVPWLAGASGLAEVERALDGFESVEVWTRVARHLPLDVESALRLVVRRPAAAAALLDNRSLDDGRLEEMLPTLTASHATPADLVVGIVRRLVERPGGVGAATAGALISQAGEMAHRASGWPVRAMEALVDDAALRPVTLRRLWKMTGREDRGVRGRGEWRAVRARLLSHPGWSETQLRGLVDEAPEALRRAAATPGASARVVALAVERLGAVVESAAELLAQGELSPELAADLIERHRGEPLVREAAATTGRGDLLHHPRVRAVLGDSRATVVLAGYVRAARTTVELTVPLRRLLGQDVGAALEALERLDPGVGIPRPLLAGALAGANAEQRERIVRLLGRHESVAAVPRRGRRGG